MKKNNIQLIIYKRNILYISSNTCTIKFIDHELSINLDILKEVLEQFDNDKDYIIINYKEKNND